MKTHDDVLEWPPLRDDDPDHWPSRVVWHGRCVSLDGAATTLPTLADADRSEVLACGSTPDDWDGYSAAVLRLPDGRYMGWSSWWGPTGSGFYEDAYGGDTDVYFATSLDVLIWEGLDAMGRSLCGYPETREVP